MWAFWKWRHYQVSQVNLWKYFFLFGVWFTHLLDHSRVVDVLGDCYFAEVLEWVVLWLWSSSLLCDHPTTLDEAVEIALFLSNTCCQFSTSCLHV
jgi:hypothetical protein